MSEPSIERFHGKSLTNRVATALAATRPAFLTASVLPVLASAALSASLGRGPIPLPLIALAVLGIALVHSGANVLNDYFDSRSGNDAANAGRVFPFSGGSRFIQNGVLSEAQTLQLGSGLIGAGTLLGLWLVSIGGTSLLVIGVIGIALAVTYSSPPCLACRGLGDVVIAVCFGVLPVVGTSVLLTGAVPREAWWLGAGFGCFVAAILWANSIPDIDADRAAGKLTLPARFGRQRASLVLPLWFVAGFTVLLGSPLPGATWTVLVAAVPALMASRTALAGRIAEALPLTILTHAMVGVVVTLSLALAA
ncbi:MAG: prenyltransferase [Hyphomicrobiaceae bacterium]|nr:prenyltransferase [Hyphomicrobiaceae bacterium]